MDPELTLVDATANGAAPAALAPAPVDEPEADKPNITIVRGQGKVRTATIQFVGPHKGMWAKVHVNAKRKVFREMQSGDEERADKAFAGLVLAHNLVDDAGQPHPQPLTYDALGELELDLYRALLESSMEAIRQAGEAPKS